MSRRRTGGRIGLASLSFLLGGLVGGSAVYLLDHRAAIGQPIYLGLFAAAALSALGVVDRMVNRRPPPHDPRRTGSRRSG
ncbi:hypothetical protein [Kitasatospora purpeofusca]|uniref:hypothetical protein n=1 Tax=Kitasatospora purpeofusca TaxID=67352 RepID=UPI0035DF2D2C